ncbi:hypothetical protein B484DRAFT_444225 [Ochromonadaceae sp. CCMP2298]|nr:hypothetical protein B484DRAFT_444225 [Ochromonadaceae sp. CCMP2298]
MKARLDEKVGRLRTQTMSFASEGGVQVSLSIPDTEDVKETFSSVATCVAEQESQIGSLATDLEETAKESASSQARVLAWTVKCVQALKDENVRLFGMLTDANKQIVNLSYNMQGYVGTDAAEAELATEMEEPPKLAMPQVVQKQAKPLPVEEEDEGAPSLFPTEDGATIDSSGLGLHTKKKDIVPRVKEAKDPATVERNRAYYENVPASTPGKTAATRWRWAFRKVLAVLRWKNMKLGFTDVRMQADQTFGGRLDRLGTNMLDMEQEFGAKVQGVRLEQSHLGSALQGVRNEVGAAASKIDLLADETKEKFSAMTQRTSDRFEQMQEGMRAMDDTVAQLVQQVQQQAEGETKQLKDSLAAIQTHLQDMVAMDVSQLAASLASLGLELVQMETAMDALLQRVESQRSQAGAIELKSTPEAALSELTLLLQLDTTLRQSRSEIAFFEGTLNSMRSNYQDVSQRIAAVQKHYAKEPSEDAVEIISPEQREKMSELQGRSDSVDGHIAQNRALLETMKRLVGDHDQRLGERYVAFEEVSGQIKGLELVGAAFVALKGEVSGLQQQVTAGVVAGAAVQAQQGQLMGMYEEDIKGLGVRLDQMEEGMMGEDDLDGLLETMVYEDEPKAEAEAEEEVVETEEEVEEEAEEEAEVVAEAEVEEPVPVEEEEEVQGDNVVSIATVEDISSPDNVSVNVLPADATEDAEPAPATPPAVSPSASVTSLTKRIKIPTPNIDDEGDEDEVDVSAPVQPAPASTPAPAAAAAPAPVTTPIPASAPARSPARSPARARALTVSVRQDQSILAGKNKQRMSATPKKSTNATIDALEAKLRPLIERIVSSQVEQRLAGMDFGYEVGYEVEEDGVEEEEAPATAVPTDTDATTISAVSEVAANPPPRRATDASPVRKQKLSVSVASAEGGPTYTPTPTTHALVRRETREKPPHQGIRKSFSGGAVGAVGGFDPSPVVQEMGMLKLESKRMALQLLELTTAKCDETEVEQICLLVLQRNGKAKDDTHARMDAHEKRMYQLSQELMDSKKSTDLAIASIQQGLSDDLLSVINQAAESMDEDHKDAYLSTRSLCLSCGRSSQVRGEPESHPSSSSFHPHLSAHSSPGADVLRGGFKIPVRVMSPEGLDPQFILGAGGHREVLGRGGGNPAIQRMREAHLMSRTHDDDNSASTGLGGVLEDHGFTPPDGRGGEAVLPRVRSAGQVSFGDYRSTMSTGDNSLQALSALESDVSQADVTTDGALIIQANNGYQLQIGSTTESKRPTSSALMASSGHGRPENEESKPVYNRGLVGKKSARAEAAYGGRFELDLPNGTLLRSNRLSNSALLPAPEGVGNAHYPAKMNNISAAHHSLQLLGPGVESSKAARSPKQLLQRPYTSSDGMRLSTAAARTQLLQAGALNTLGGPRLSSSNSNTRF